MEDCSRFVVEDKNRSEEEKRVNFLLVAGTVSNFPVTLASLYYVALLTNSVSTADRFAGLTWGITQSRRFRAVILLLCWR